MKLYLAWLLAIGGMFMSLYFSEVKRVEPCHLCWLQRLALFPLVIQLGIAAYQGDAKSAKTYLLPLALIGFIAALFQALQPWLKIHQLCGAGLDCTQEPAFFFGTIHFSWVSAIGFVLIALLLLFSQSKIVQR